MKAWHFTADNLRDGRPLPSDGEKLIHDGELVMCKSGLHASKRIIDALYYAPGHMIHRVECGGEIIRQDDKLVCTERTILWSVDGEDLLRAFARRCALDVIHLWNPPQIVVDYLRTGDGSKRAAEDAARAASWAAEDAARASARAAAWAAASRAAAWAATSRAAAWATASRAAARDATEAAQNKRLTRMVNYAHNKGK